MKLINLYININKDSDMVTFALNISSFFYLQDMHVWNQMRLVTRNKSCHEIGDLGVQGTLVEKKSF